MSIPLQPTLENDTILLRPLQAADWEAMYQVAADPRIWEQHPNRDRWRREVFATFFEGAMQSQGAFSIIAKATGQCMGCTRFYGYDEAASSIHIGYTFYGTQYWGKGINLAVKALMLNYIFQYVSRVDFHIGASNIRSQLAISRLGAVKVSEQEVAYYGEAPKLNYTYSIAKDNWLATTQQEGA